MHKKTCTIPDAYARKLIRTNKYIVHKTSNIYDTVKLVMPNSAKTDVKT